MSEVPAHVQDLQDMYAEVAQMRGMPFEALDPDQLLGGEWRIVVRGPQGVVRMSLIEARAWLNGLSLGWFAGVDRVVDDLAQIAGPAGAGTGDPDGNPAVGSGS